ncbi:MAG: 6-carboxytetrahydropterin synthase [Euryarchaeota archaeon]|nr:6-carboxytetrahydropterin synthase [Euryarchaeota archaeon]
MLEVKIDGWQKGIRFSSAHTTPELGKCERLHGHTYAMHCIITGEQNPKGIVYDFVDITNAMRQIADEIDHLVLVPTEGRPRINVTVEGGEVKMETMGRKYLFPRDDCALLPIRSATAENLCQYVLNELVKRAKLPPEISQIKLGVDEGYGQGAWCTWTPNGKKVKK